MDWERYFKRHPEKRAEVEEAIAHLSNPENIDEFVRAMRELSPEPRTVLSSYRSGQPPRAFGDNGVIFHTPGGVLQEWARGYYPNAETPRVFWLRRLTDTQRNDAEARLLPAPSLLAASMERERVYIAGGVPTGIPLGIADGELRWPNHADYYRNGWLAPGDKGFDGGPAWYPCASYEHERLASALFADADIEAEGLGWCRIQNGTPVFASRNKRGPTDAQSHFFLAHGIR